MVTTGLVIGRVLGKQTCHFEGLLVFPLKPLFPSLFYLQPSIIFFVGIKKIHKSGIKLINRSPNTLASHLFQLGNHCLA